MKCGVRTSTIERQSETLCPFLRFVAISRYSGSTDKSASSNTPADSKTQDEESSSECCQKSKSNGEIALPQLEISNPNHFASFTASTLVRNDYRFPANGADRDRTDTPTCKSDNARFSTASDRLSSLRPPRASAFLKAFRTLSTKIIRLVRRQSEWGIGPKRENIRGNRMIEDSVIQGEEQSLDRIAFLIDGRSLFRSNQTLPNVSRAELRWVPNRDFPFELPNSSWSET
jgi:hypothetical protein